MGIRSSLSIDQRLQHRLFARLNPMTTSIWHRLVIIPARDEAEAVGRATMTLWRDIVDIKSTQLAVSLRKSMRHVLEGSKNKRHSGCLGVFVEAMLMPFFSRS
jgi:hypothetical protein